MQYECFNLNGKNEGSQTLISHNYSLVNWYQLSLKRKLTLQFGVTSGHFSR